jgi:16S rRNA G966 N2-methylase RsmD
MACCTGCGRYPAAEQQFGAAAARRDLERYRRKGPDASSRLLLDGIAEVVRPGDSLLDVGGGVGVLGFELLARGVGRATLVDASSAYLDSAQLEASRREVTERMEVIHGDVVHLDGAISSADIVTMHRVICCYPDFGALLDKATQLTRRLLAFSYPRDAWYVRAFMGFENARRRLFGNAFRTFVHPPQTMEAYVATAGFHRIDRRQTPVWRVDVYRRRDAV